MADVERIARRLQDQSTAPLSEKLRRFLSALADKRGHSGYFYDDGFPRSSLHEDATVYLDLLEAGAIVAPVPKEAPSEASRGEVADVRQLQTVARAAWEFVNCATNLDDDSLNPLRKALAAVFPPATPSTHGGGR